MKKIYLSPAIETQILTASLMQTGGGSPSNSGVNGGSTGGDSGRDPMPRKPF